MVPRRVTNHSQDASLVEASRGPHDRTSACRSLVLRRANGPAIKIEKVNRFVEPGQESQRVAGYYVDFPVVRDSRDVVDFRARRDTHGIDRTWAQMGWLRQREVLD